MPASSHFSSRTVTSWSSGASETSWGTSSSDYFWHYHWIPPHFMASNLFTELRLTHWWRNARQNCRIDLFVALPFRRLSRVRQYTANLECQDAPVTCLGVSTETDTGIQVTASGAPPHPRPYCRGRVWRSFDTDLESRVFEAPFACLVFTNAEKRFGNCSS